MTRQLHIRVSAKTALDKRLATTRIRDAQPRSPKNLMLLQKRMNFSFCPPTPCKSSVIGQRRFEAVDEHGLSGVGFLASYVGREPAGPIYFGNFNPATRAAWKLDASGVALDVGCVGVAFEGPGVDKLAGLLLDCTQWNESLWSSSWHSPSYRHEDRKSVV